MTPGWKTSEFWLSLAAMVMPAISALQGFPNPWISLPAAAIAGAYAVSRGTVKKADALATAHVEAGYPVGTLPAFGAATADEKAAAKADGASAIRPLQGPPPAAP